MKWRAYFRALFYLTALLLFSIRCFAGDFIDIQAELETVNWGWRGEFNPPTADPYITRLHCIVGTNSWMITTSFLDKSWWHAGSNLVEESWWYTGTNLVRRFETPDSQERRKVSHQSDAVEYQTRTMEFDGNVDGGMGRANLSPQVKIAWLAFCSGPFLKRDKREVPMANDFWKETWLWREHRAQPAGFKDQTLVFDDELGLPKSVDVFTSGNQRLLEYRIRHLAGPILTTTNVLGWEVPLEFYLAQFLPGRTTNAWEVVLTAKGRTTAVTVGKQPQILLGKTNGRDQSYVVRAGGPSAYNLISHPPSQNNARLLLKKRLDDPSQATFTITNDEPEEILVWNVRIQMPSSSGQGTDGFGWDTIYDDYPNMAKSSVEAGHSGELTVKLPDADRWRVCLLYSKLEKGPSANKSYSGNYEIVSEEIRN